MKRTTINLIKYPGFAFMIVSTIMFYNHLFTAAGNKGFFVNVYFDMMGEGLFELMFFLIALPFIWITIALEFISLRRELDGSRSKSNS